MSRGEHDQSSKSKTYEEILHFSWLESRLVNLDNLAKPLTAFIASTVAHGCTRLGTLRANSHVKTTLSGEPSQIKPVGTFVIYAFPSAVKHRNHKRTDMSRPNFEKDFQELQSFCGKCR